MYGLCGSRIQDAELGSRLEQDQDSVDQCHYERERKTETKASIENKSQETNNTI